MKIKFLYPSYTISQILIKLFFIAIKKDCNARHVTISSIKHVCNNQRKANQIQASLPATLFYCLDFF